MIDKIVGYYIDLFKESSFWNSIELWRNACFILLVLFGLIYLFRQKLIKLVSRKDMIEHDKKVFVRSNEILSERKVLDALEILEGFYRYGDNYLLNSEVFCRFFEEEGNSYLNKNLKNSSKDLILSISKLNSFIAKHFFLESRSQPGPNFTFELFPEDIDERGRKSERYLEAEKQLPNLTKSVRISYSKYRKLIKELLLM